MLTDHHHHPTLALAAADVALDVVVWVYEEVWVALQVALELDVALALVAV